MSLPLLVEKHVDNLIKKQKQKPKNIPARSSMNY